MKNPAKKRARGRPPGIRLNRERGIALLKWFRNYCPQDCRDSALDLDNVANLAPKIWQQLQTTDFRQVKEDSIRSKLADEFCGRRTMPQSTIVALARLCEIDPSYLFGALKENSALPTPVSQTESTFLRESNAQTSPSEQERSISPKHNLPEPSAHFFGHQQMMEDVKRQLASNGLMVIHETGGMGKTTFVSVVANRALKEKLFPGGAVWINCEANRTLDECLQLAVRVLLGIENVAEDTLTEILVNHFATAHTLLVFDNFESIFRSAEDVQDAFNRFLRDHSMSASLLVTTQRIHQGMKDRGTVLLLPTLLPQDAWEMFVQQSGVANFSSDDRRIVEQMCESIGNLPLGILLLAKQAQRFPVRHLLEELTKNIESLASDDRFLERRHRSCMACFEFSFAHIKDDSSAIDTLYRISFLPEGLGAESSREYLNNPKWMESLSVCENAALLRFEKNRYTMHPLIRSLLHVKMGSQKDQWAHYWIDFFCTYLDAAANEGRIPHLALTEKSTCCKALKAAAARLNREYILILMEMIPCATDRGMPLPCPFPGHDNSESKQWVEREDRCLNALLAQARALRDDRRVKRILRVKLRDLFNGAGEAEALAELCHVTHESEERGLRFDFAARKYFRKRDWESSEASLEKSIQAWQSAGPNFKRNRAAAMVNLLGVLFRQDKSEKAATAAKNLRTVWTLDCGVISENLEWRDTEDGPSSELEWWIALTPIDDIRDALFISPRTLGDAAGAPLEIGRQLLRLEQWSESAAWLELALAAAKIDPLSRVASRIFGCDPLLFDFADACLKCGRTGQAGDAYTQLAKDAQQSGSLTVRGRVAKGLALLAAEEGNFREAIKRGKLGIKIFEMRLDEIADREQPDEEWDYLAFGKEQCENEVRELKAALAKWKIQTKKRASSTKKVCTN
jgi:hypothetical protein